ncbi:fl-2-d [Drosophila busckii]|uniref:Fl-2-d n=1 Tax=Drosophila busckii TaxID=30019 RepID=A0A0M4E8H0_DROBS|nr:fl-2-d [Drosophila busckii]
MILIGTHEIENLKLEVQRMGMQCADAMRREKILMRRLANKEQEFQDYVSQIAEYKAQQAPTALALRTALLDPAVNLLFERLKKELKNTKAKLEETQNELSAWKFTPDSNTGKRLMAKCRLLYQENEELGKMTSNGRLAKLETELAMQKSFSEEVKKSQSELDDFLQELDEDVEGMQSTILFLQQELKTTRDRIQTLEKENVQLKQANNGVSQKTATDNAAITTNGNVNNVNNGNNNSNSSSNLNKLDTINESVEENGTEFHTHDANNEQSNNEAAQSAADNAAARLARKRNYEEEESAPVVVAVTGVQELPALPAMREVSTPRTLPPKKSKLRGIATRRSSQLDEEQSMVITATTTTTAAATITPPQVLENVVIVSEEAAAAAAAATANTAEQATPVDMEANADAQSAAPARILTRRRSVRMQQNGGGVGGGVEY